tara:strand:- start:304 stop:582 length:279 start_codon:yes stop_codon:yes gene_type:complete
MKKAKLKLTGFDVDGPFLKARERLLDFNAGFTFVYMVQATLDELKEQEDKYETAMLMGDMELAAKAKKEVEALTRSLVYGAKLLEEESGIDA